MIEVAARHFTTREDAIAEVEASGLHVAEVDITQDELTGSPHAHPYRVEIYMLAGLLELHEPDTGNRHILEAGDKAVVPAGTRHEEICPSHFHAVFGVSEDPKQLMATRGAIGVNI